MRIVYVVQDSPGKNLEPAKKFGEIKILLSPRDAEKDSFDILMKLRDRLIRVESEDYVLLIGDPLAIGLTMMVIFDRVNGINALRWDRKRYKYEEIRVEV